MSLYAMESLAQTLYGMMLTDPEGRYYQVVAVRTDEQARKIYGRCREMYEAAPYMFAPVSEIPTWIRRGDERIGKRAVTKDSLGNTVDGEITAILKYGNGMEKIEVKQGTTTVWADPATVNIL